MKEEEIKRVQTALKARYYEPGPIDGKIGPKTLSALRAFLFEHDFRGNSEPAPTAQTLNMGILAEIESAPIWARIIDLAHWQDGNKSKVGNLSEAKASGICGAFIKAGGADSKKGTGLYQDSEYSLYSQQARACDLRQGAYWFHHFSKDPIQQAEKFFAIVGQLQPGDLPPCLDVEDYKTRIKGQAALDHIMATLTRIEELFKVRPILYTSASVLKTHYADLGVSPLSAYPLFIPAYGVKSPARRIPACYKGEWDFWQVGFDDGLPGFSNDVDRDFFKGTAEDLAAICVKA